MKNKILSLLPILLLICFGMFSCRPLARHKHRHQELAKQFQNPSDSRDFLNLSYGPYRTHDANLLDLRVPKNGKGPFPLVIYIHGGSWSRGDKSMFPTLLLLANGYAIASINYRLSSDAKFPAQIEDCKNAICWLRANADKFSIDPNNIGVWGHSAGGHLAALVGTTCDATKPDWAAAPSGKSNQVQAVCDWCGPTDLLKLFTTAAPSTGLPYAVAAFLGASPKDKPELARLADPMTYAHKGCPPFLIMHGNKDEVVPIEQSQELVKCLKDNGVDCTFIEIPGKGHNIYSFENERTVLDFFDRTLKSKHL